MKKIILIAIAVFITIQFIPSGKKNPPIDQSKEFVNILNPPEHIRQILENSCYDCHSHETEYPWYSYVAPASWIIKEHVNNGRRHLNFSVWSDYKESKKDVKLEECIEMIRTGEMPMQGYVLFHQNAEIDPSQKEELIEWFSSKISD
jgi:hypothetical protein